MTEPELRRRLIARIFDVDEQLLPLPELGIAHAPTIAEPELAEAPAEAPVETPVRGPVEAPAERELGLRS